LIERNRQAIRVSMQDWKGASFRMRALVVNTRHGPFWGGHVRGPELVEELPL
jgi:hypothetical protein